MWICECVSLYVYTYISVYNYWCIYSYISITYPYPYERMHICIYTSKCICVYVKVYIYIYIYIERERYALVHTLIKVCVNIYYIIIVIIISPRQRVSPYIGYIFKTTSCIGTEPLYIGSSWSSFFCSTMWRGSLEYVTYEFVPTYPAISHMSGSSNLNSFRDG